MLKYLKYTEKKLSNLFNNDTINEDDFEFLDNRRIGRNFQSIANYIGLIQDVIMSLEDDRNAYTDEKDGFLYNEIVNIQSAEEGRRVDDPDYDKPNLEQSRNIMRGSGPRIPPEAKVYPEKGAERTRRRRNRPISPEIQEAIAVEAEPGSGFNQEPFFNILGEESGVIGVPQDEFVDAVDVSLINRNPSRINRVYNRIIPIRRRRQPVEPVRGLNEEEYQDMMAELEGREGFITRRLPNAFVSNERRNQREVQEVEQRYQRRREQENIRRDREIERLFNQNLGRLRMYNRPEEIEYLRPLLDSATSLELMADETERMRLINRLNVLIPFYIREIENANRAGVPLNEYLDQSTDADSDEFEESEASGDGIKYGKRREFFRDFKDQRIVGKGLSNSQKTSLVNKVRTSNTDKDNMMKDYEKLEKFNCDKIQSKDFKPLTQVGADFINYFTMKDRLETKGNKGINFYDFWEKRSELEKKKYIINLMNYYKKRGSKQSQEQIWYRIFNIYYGSINIFKPTIAMMIYCRFKPKHILDYTMGWGGRLVGACALDIPEYTGIDLNKSIEPAYNKMVSVLKTVSSTKINLKFQNALYVDYSKMNYDLVLTSPPYYNIEEYKGSKNISKEKWDKEFYEPIFRKTYDGLKSGGHYCLNVPDDVYKNVCIKVLGKASMFIPLPKSSRSPNETYKEFIYVWKK